MKKANVPNAHMLLDGLHRFLVPSARAEVVPRREHVARIEADADALVVVDRPEDLPQLFKGAADARSLSGRGLQERDHVVIRSRRVHPIERPGNLLDSCVRSRAHMSAW